MRKTTPQRAAMLLAGLVLAPLLACAATRNDSPALVPWTFHADWSGGFSGWMSFPLAQDIGYDPTLYTVKLGDTAALRHNFISHGEPNPWFGFIRPLSFTADARTRVALRYRLDLTTALAQPEIMLVAADGHHYTAPLAAGNGDHSVSITGAQLHLAGATHIVAIILRGRLEHPPVYSESQWLLEQFELHAERTPEVALSSPKLNTTVDGSHVADITLAPGGTLAIERTSASVPATVTLYDATGATSRFSGPARRHSRSFLAPQRERPARPLESRDRAGSGSNQLPVPRTRPHPAASSSAALAGKARGVAHRRSLRGPAQAGPSPRRDARGEDRVQSCGRR